MTTGAPLPKRTGSRTSRRNGTKTKAYQIKRREHYRECLDRRKNKSKPA
jgi:hypothetical protein